MRGFGQIERSFCSFEKRWMPYFQSGPRNAFRDFSLACFRRKTARLQSQQINGKHLLMMCLVYILIYTLDLLCTHCIVHVFSRSSISTCPHGCCNATFFVSFETSGLRCGWVGFSRIFLDCCFTLPVFTPALFPFSSVDETSPKHR